MRFFFIFIIFSFSVFGEENAPQISSREQELIDIGLFDHHEAGYALKKGIFPGFGEGHSALGYDEKAKIFYRAETLSLGSFFLGATVCTLRTIPGQATGGDKSCTTQENFFQYIGLSGFLIFKIWELLDISSLPGRHNMLYRRLKKKLENDELSFSSPNPKTLGITFRF